MTHKHIFKIALVTVLITVLLAVAFMLPTAATEEDAHINVAYCNLSFENETYLLYAIPSTDANLRLLIWDEYQTEYTYGTQTAELTSIGTATIGGVAHKVFKYTGVAAKNMTDDIYARPYIKSTKTYGQVTKYSILQYAYRMLGKTDTATTNQKLINMLNTMLAFGASAQEYHGYKTDRLATDDFVQVKLTDGTLPDGFTSGLYLVGESISITAHATDADGVAFTGWQNVSGRIISSEQTITVTVGSKNTTYTACYGTPVLPTVDEFLTFTLQDDNTYSVSVSDTEKLPADLEIPAEHNGYAVTHIAAQAFANCTNLVSVTIPDSVTGIGIAAFSGCSNLTGITVPFIGASTDSADTKFGYLFSTSNSNGKVPSSLKTVVITAGDRIGASAFSGCSYLTSVDIPDSITVIGDSAFQSCTRLTGIQLPDGLTDIGAYAFQSCKNLASIDIPAGITSIGNSAFSNCTSFTKVNIPDSVTVLGNSAFSNCSKLTDITIGSGVTSIGKDTFDDCSKLTNIELPAGITAIGESAFHSCTSLTNIQIPAGVTSIGNSAFSGCSQLVSIDIPDTVTSIGSSAFMDCSNLISVDLPNSITSLSSGIFTRCYGLTSLDIPDSVTSVGTGAFTDCTGIIEVEGGVSYVDNWAIKSDSTVTEAILRPGTVGVAVSGLGSHDSIVLLDGVRYLCRDSLGTCDSITIPNTVISIDENALLYNSISTVYYTGTLGEWRTVTRGHESCLSRAALHIGTVATEPTNESYFTFTLLEDGMFSVAAKDVTTLPADLVIPSAYNGVAVTHIADEGFRDATGLITVIIPDSITSIGTATFAGCSNMVTLKLPFIGSSNDSVDDMHFGYLFSSSSNSESFQYVPSTLADIVLTLEDRIGDEAFHDCSNLKSITLPDSVTSIGQSAFRRCSGLTSMTLPAAITSIGDAAFEACHNLASINIPAGVTSIGNNVFDSCALTDIDLPDDLTSIGNHAFDGCRFTSIEIPSKVKTIGSHAFYSCSLTTVVIPDSVQSIGNHAFAQCSSLTSVTLGNGVTSIGDNAFHFCHDLTKIVIPDNVQTIGNSAFSECSDLVSITIGSGVTQIGLTAFSGCSGIIQIENGVSYVDKWVIDCDTSVTEVVLRADTVGIADNAFSNCKSLVSIDIPESVVNIGEYAFEYCSGLVSVDLPDGITVIRDGTFTQCLKLADIVIPEGVTYIGNSAFSGCAFTSINIPDGVTFIGGSAFGSCSNLTFIIIPDGVTTIYEYTFSNCSSLTSIVLNKSVTFIYHYTFRYSGLETVYYTGTPEEWNAITDNPLASKAVYFYSEYPILDSPYATYRHWYYANGVPTLCPLQSGSLDA